MTDTQKDDRFVLVYTKGDTVGTTTRKTKLNQGGGASEAIVDDFLIKAEATADGKIEVETEPATKPQRSGTGGESLGQ